MFHFSPLAQSEIDWDEFLKTSLSALARSPTDTLDRKGAVQIKDYAYYLSCLREFQSPGSQPFGLVGALGEHLSFSFFILATKGTTLNILNAAKVKSTTVVSKQEDFYLTILSGTLVEWRSVILNCCVDTVPYDIKVFGTKLLEYFEQLNIKRFLFSADPIRTSDGTYRLTIKDQ